MDDYKRLYYMHRRDLIVSIKIGNLKALRLLSSLGLMVRRAKTMATFHQDWSFENVSTATASNGSSITFIPRSLFWTKMSLLTER